LPEICLPGSLSKSDLKLCLFDRFFDCFLAAFWATALAALAKDAFFASAKRGASRLSPLLGRSSIKDCEIKEKFHS
jgi:hypothetical protein